MEEVIEMPDVNTYCRGQIEKEAASALETARWYAAHVVEFLSVIERTENNGFIQMVRDSEKFYVHEWSPEDVTEQARNDYMDALKIVANTERIIQKLGR